MKPQIKDVVLKYAGVVCLCKQGTGVKFQKSIYMRGNYDIFSHSLAGNWLEKYTSYKSK